MLSKFKAERGIYIATAVQAALLVLTAFGFLPRETMFFSSVILGLYILTLPAETAFKLFILLIPWFVAVPMGSADRFQAWRIFIVEILLLAFWKEKFKFNFSKIDYAFFAFLVTGLLAGQYFATGLRFVIWLINIYLVYFVARILIKEQTKQEFIKTAGISVLTIVAIGFIQLLAYLFLPYTFFWQYWANTFIPVLYGTELASLQSHFNSWFAYFKDGAPGLRMFSLMPGSHYFALFTTLGLAYLMQLREVNKSKWTIPTALLILGIVFSSVRGVWVGALVPVVVLIALFLFKKFDRFELKKATVPFLIFLIMFLASPILNKIFTTISPHNQGLGSLYARAQTSFDPYETSNNMRLELWKISWGSVKEHPLFGLGFGNFPLVFGNLSGKSIQELANEPDPIIGIPKKHVSAHNLFLEILVEAGLLGFMAFMVFLFYIFRMLWQKYKVNKSAFAMFFAVSLIWILGQEMFDVSFLLNDKTLILFWLGLGLIDA